MTGGRCPVGIVGIGCRFPRRVRGPEEFWEFIETAGDAVTDIPADRWEWQAFYDPDPAKPAKMQVRRGAFLEQPIEEFDAAFFGVSPREAAQLDPQQRLLLEVTWEALEDTGLDVWSLRGSATSVHIGSFMLDNLLQQAGPNARDGIGPQTATTCTTTVLASRLSYFFDLRGPSMAIDTACSSSLVAVHQAVQTLTAGEADLALAGGVNRIFRPEPTLMMSKGQFLAADGRSKSFSAAADGYGRGEGCGVVVLKRLDDAERDGDRIYAVIEGTGVNQDGRTAGPAVPSATAQATLIATVLSQAGVAPADVDYVEAHGTGTPVGDPIEMQALGQTVGRAADRQRRCVVGSVKAGIGHLEGAAGVAGLIKAALVAQRGVVPPQSWLDEISPEIDHANLGLEIAVERTALTPTGRPRYVGVNSFGYGGTNAHVMLREHIEQTIGPPAAGSDPTSTSESFFPPVALVSAHDDSALGQLAGTYSELLHAATGDDRRQRELLASFAVRTPHPLRWAVPGDPTSTVGVLSQLSAGTQHPDLISGQARSSLPVAPVFVFSGMGPQWWAMGRELIQSHPVFRAHVQRCDETFAEMAGWSLFDELTTPQEASRMTFTAVAQPASFVLQSGIAAVLAEVGVTPGAVVGHSLGELAAAHLAGCIDLDDALTIAYHRARLLATTSGVGGMLATELGDDDARALVADHGSLVSIAAVNSASASTLSGDVDALEKIEQELKAKGLFYRWLPVEVAYHSPAMDPVLPQLRTAIAGIAPQAGRVRAYSTVEGKADDALRDVDYWVANTREPVTFHTTATRMLDDGHRVFLEIGAHPVLSLYLHQLVGSTPGGKVIPTLHRQRSDRETLLEALAQLWTNGVAVDWTPVLGRASTRSLPPYPWQRQVHWHEPAGIRRDRTGEHSGDLLAGRAMSTLPVVRDVELSPTTLAWSRDHRVDGTSVFPAMGYVEVVISHARAQANGVLPVVIEDLAIERPLVLGDHEDPILRLVEGDDGRVTLSSRGRRDADVWALNARARVARGRYDPPQTPDRAGTDGSGSIAELSKPEIYQQLSEIGLDYQGDFRSARRVIAHVDRAAVDVALENGAAVPSGYTAYPPLLDAGLHGALAAYQADNPGLYVPVHVDRVVVHGELPATCGVTATIAPGRGLDSVMVDLQFCDASGSCLIDVRGVGLRRVNKPEARDDWLDTCTYEPRWVPLQDPADAEADRVTPRTSQWHVVGRSDALVDTVASALPAGCEVTRSTDVDEFLEVGLDGASTLVVDLDAETADQAAAHAGGLAGLASRLAQPVSGITQVVFVTHDALAVRPEDRAPGWTNGWVTSFRRTLANELPRILLRHIDDDGRDPRGLRAALLCTTADEIAVRDGGLYRPELVPLTTAAEPDGWWTVAIERPAAEVESFTLFPTASTLQGLEWVESTRRAPDPGEIELRVDAVGLNHKDVLKQLGALDADLLRSTFVGPALGMEACVVVERVGEGVDAYRPGERYAASLAGGCFARHLTLDVEQVRLLPADPSWTDAETAGMLVALGTARHTIAELARLEPGETLLVHGATGGFGLAALQVARACNASVLASASTEAKRSILREMGVTHTFDSRSFDFVDEVLAVTDGRGVDVVINTLPGDGLRANLAVVAEGGRVVDISRREVLDQGNLPLALFDKQVTFTSFDLDRLANERDRFLALGARVLERTGDGTYRPPLTTRFSAARIKDAFSHLARAEHVGKVVVDLTDQTYLRCHEARCSAGPIRDDRTYVVTGGTGAVGLRLARWLADRGARHLALVSRRGHLDQTGQHLVEELGNDGVEVVTAAVDVSEADAVQQFLAGRRTAGTPLGGIVHAAGISHDRPVLGLSADDMHSVLQPKLLGATNLHHATLNDPLDLFLVISSVSSITGTSGQAAYAAANAAVEALMTHRRRQRRPGIAIALGPVAEIGMAARAKEIERYVQLLGFTPLPPERLPAIFDRALEWNRAILAAFDLDWSVWGLAEPHAATSHRFDIVREHARLTASKDSTAILARLAAMPQDQRIEVIGQHVKDALAIVLGMDSTALGMDTRLTSLGLDSLMFLEAQTHLNRTLDANLTLMGFLGMDTITDVANNINQTIQAKL